MSEIRPICEAEAEPFLALLCGVFDLDVSRARGVFFNEPFFDLKRKWALFEEGRMVSILTTVPLSFGWGAAIGIAGVATAKEHQRKGKATQLLEAVLAQAERSQEAAAFLFARETGFYERCGFRALDIVVRARIRSHPEPRPPDPMEIDEVVRRYDFWSGENPDRLRRDPRRWNYWKWNLKLCSPLHGGYLCLEGGMVREALTHELHHSWPLPEGTQWLGLQGMAALMGVPLLDPVTELFLMGRGAPAAPQMFLTDQF